MFDRVQQVWSSVRRASRSYVVVVAVALLVGALVAPVAYGAARDYADSDDAVAVVSVPSTIAPGTADAVHDDLREARQNDSIRAVVLKVNTPGGGLSATEALFLDVERTAEQMPVVASVGQMAASGGYYVSAPADEIYAKPSAQVGSVGIRYSYVDAAPASGSITSGPDKDGGYTEADALRQADAMVQGFYGAVMDHRGDDLELTREELAYAKVYASQEAVHNGLIDGIGTTETAIQAAADRADVDDYDVVEFEAADPLDQLVLETTADGDVVDLTDEHVRALLEPAPGIDTPVALALYGTLPDEEPIVDTAGGGPAVVEDREVTDDE